MSIPTINPPMPNGMQLINIVVETRKGKCLIEAEVIGQFAVHALQNRGMSGWTVTHMRTGYAFTSWTHRHVAVNWARKFNRIVDVERGIVDKAYFQAIKEVIKNSTRHPAFVDTKDGRSTTAVERYGLL